MYNYEPFMKRSYTNNIVISQDSFEEHFIERIECSVLTKMRSSDTLTFYLNLMKFREWS